KARLRINFAEFLTGRICRKCRVKTFTSSQINHLAHSHTYLKLGYTYAQFSAPDLHTCISITQCTTSDHSLRETLCKMPMPLVQSINRTDADCILLLNVAD